MKFTCKHVVVMINHCDMQVVNKQLIPKPLTNKSLLNRTINIIIYFVVT